MKRLPRVFTWADRNSVSTGLTDLPREVFDSIQLPGMGEDVDVDRNGKVIKWYKRIVFGGEWDPIEVRSSDRVELRFETYEAPIVSQTEVKP